jgi:uncharacterized protein (TIGR03437 family)
MLKKSIWLVCFVTGFLALQAAAQTPKGRIVDLNGQAVAGVEIKIDGFCINRGGIGTGSYSHMRQSDSNGEFAWDLPCGGSDSASYVFRFIKPGYVFTRGGVLKYSYIIRGIGLPPPVDERLPVVYAAPTTIPTWTVVSGADYGLGVANEMIVAGFGNSIAATTVTATLPLPTTFGARKIVIRDQHGKEAAAQFLFVSPNQINFVMPSGLAEGACQVKLLDGGDNVRWVDLPLLYVTRPSLFTANADGKGVPAALIVRVKPGNVQSFESVAQYDQQQKKWLPLPIDLGPENESVFLVLYGTGWRNQVTTGVSTIVVLADVRCDVTYVGAQLVLDGLDQINARIPRSLIGRGDVNLYVPMIVDNSTGFPTSITWPLKIK